MRAHNKNCFYFLQDRNIWLVDWERNRLSENQADNATESGARGEPMGRMWWWPELGNPGMGPFLGWGFRSTVNQGIGAWGWGGKSRLHFQKDFFWIFLWEKKKSLSLSKGKGMYVERACDSYFYLVGGRSQYWVCASSHVALQRVTACACCLKWVYEGAGVPLDVLYRGAQPPGSPASWSNMDLM